MAHLAARATAAHLGSLSISSTVRGSELLKTGATITNQQGSKFVVYRERNHVTESFKLVVGNNSSRA